MAANQRGPPTTNPVQHIGRARTSACVVEQAIEPVILLVVRPSPHYRRSSVPFRMDGNAFIN